MPFFVGDRGNDLRADCVASATLSDAHVGAIWSIRKFPTETRDAKKPGNPGFLLGIRKDHSEISSNNGRVTLGGIIRRRAAVLASREVVRDFHPFPVERVPAVGRGANSKVAFGLTSQVRNQDKASSSRTLAAVQIDGSSQIRTELDSSESRRSLENLDFINEPGQSFLRHARNA